MTTTEPTTRPKASDFQADPETRRTNAQRYNGSKHEDECFFCGRGLTASGLANAWWVHLTTSGYLVTQDYGSVREDAGEVQAAEEFRLSQGCFPVGSECAKRIARPYKFRMEG